MRIGFSTGSVAFDDVRLGVEIAAQSRANAVELSALRENELDPLLESLDSLDCALKAFEYVSFHAPSKRRQLTESQFVEKLRRVAERGWAIVVHPDVIENFALWKSLGRSVCIENMDKRKAVGQTAVQLLAIFDRLPDATLCFDIGHARQVDPTMQEAEAILRTCRDRLCQIHMSYVTSGSDHERLNFESIRSFSRVAHLIPESVPIILETPVTSADANEEIGSAESIMATRNKSDRYVKLTSKCH